MRFPELILLTLWLALFGGQLLAAHGIRGQAARPSPKAKKPVNTLVVYVYAEVLCCPVILLVKFQVR